uniref:AbrB family transcriptional regulator n=1 Tax=Cupriavidus taiwanensis TaxID=164546 RepID=UPI0011C0465B
KNADRPVAILFGLIGGWAISKFAGVDRATAHFATAMGGAPEMAVAAEREGACIDQVVTSHMLRVLLTVSIVPAAVQYGAQLTPHLKIHGASFLPTIPLVLLAGIALCCAVAAKRYNFPNAYALIPLFVTAGVTASDLAVLEEVPRWISVCAQILVAVSLGARFSPESLAASRRLLVPIVLYSLVSIGMAALGGVALAKFLGMPASTGVLSLAPGGMADMGIAADALGLAVPIVTGFHVIRVALVVLLSWPAYKCVRYRRTRPGAA